MRDYSIVSPHFWTGSTGKELRKCPEAMIVSMYLLTSPHANMLGLYYMPILYIAHETGLGMDGACKGLQWAKNSGFCDYDDATEVVWVYEMARFQISEQLKEADKRCIGVQKEYNSLPNNAFLSEFYDKYHKAFCMVSKRDNSSKNTRGLQGASMPHRSQEQEQDQEQEQEQEKNIGETGSPDSDAQPDSEIPVQSKKQTKPKTQKFDATAIDLPDHIDRDIWNGFVEMRNLIKKPMTERAAESIVDKLDSMGRKDEKPKNGVKPELIDPTLANTALDNSIRNNWQDVFVPKDQTRPIGLGNTQSPRQPYQPRFSGQAAMEQHYQNQPPFDENTVIQGECRNV